MADTLAIELNRDRPYAIDPATEVFETTDSFMVVLKNEGAGRHMEIQLDGALADEATLDEGTHFVGSGAIWSTTVAVDSPRRPTQGILTIGMGYGKEICEIPIRLGEPESEPSDSDLDSPDQVKSSLRNRVQFRNLSRRVRTMEVSQIGIVFGSLIVVLAFIALLTPLDVGIMIGGILLTGAVGVSVYFFLMGRDTDQHGRQR